MACLCRNSKSRVNTQGDIWGHLSGEERERERENASGDIFRGGRERENASVGQLSRGGGECVLLLVKCGKPLRCER